MKFVCFVQICIICRKWLYKWEANRIIHYQFCILYINKINFGLLSLMHSIHPLKICCSMLFALPSTFIFSSISKWRRKSFNRATVMARTFSLTARRQAETHADSGTSRTFQIYIYGHNLSVSESWDRFNVGQFFWPRHIFPLPLSRSYIHTPDDERFNRQILKQQWILL